MREALDEMPIRARIVIGVNESEWLPVGEEVGAGGGQFDLAVHPLEGRGVVARGGSGAVSMLAVGDPDSLTTLPQMYMSRMAVGPVARDPMVILRLAFQYLADIGLTRTLVMCTRCNWMLFADGIHSFRRERREEVRLPGV